MDNFSKINYRLSQAMFSMWLNVLVFMLSGFCAANGADKACSIDKVVGGIKEYIHINRLDLVWIEVDVSHRPMVIGVELSKKDNSPAVFGHIDTMQSMTCDFVLKVHFTDSFIKDFSSSSAESDADIERIRVGSPTITSEVAFGSVGAVLMVAEHRQYILTALHNIQHPMYKNIIFE